MSRSEKASKLISDVARSLVLRSEILPRELGTMVADNPERVIVRNALPIAQALQGLVVFWHCAALLTNYRLQGRRSVSMIERSKAEIHQTHEVSSLLD